MKTLLIIGAGPGGYECAVRAAKAGLDVHIADRADHVGGTCLNEGCIPTKCLCHSAETLEAARAATALGIQADCSSFSLAQAMAHKDQVTASLQTGIHTLLSTPGITFHAAEARFAPNNPHKVYLGEEELQADYVFIATGSLPKFLPIPGAHTPGVLTSTELLQLTEVPARLCIIGGGVIGLEFASIFRSFGSEVTVIEYCKRFCPTLIRHCETSAHPLKKRGITSSHELCTAIHADETRNGELRKLRIPQCSQGPFG
ncbi:MAG: FAD-dependent oxidoreductase [Prevotellamassilia sp.]